MHVYMQDAGWDFLKAIALIGPKTLTQMDINSPTLGPNDLLVRTKVVGICGSDLHSYVGAWMKPNYYRIIRRTISRINRNIPISLGWFKILGHEFSGNIEAVGENVSNFERGERIAATPNISCHECEACTMGYENLCVKDMELGCVGIQGAIAEYVKIPAENAFSIPSNLSYEEAAMTDCVAAAIHATNLAQIKKDNTIAILGAGTIGLLLLQVLKTFGLEKIAITDLYDYNLSIAKKLTAEYTFNASRVDVCEEIRKVLGPIDRVFECVGGTAPTLGQALSLVGYHGRTIVLGNFTRADQIEMIRFRKKESALIGCSRYTKSDFRKALEMLVNKRINARPLITHKFPASRAREAFETALNKHETKSIKVQIEF
jgi:L-iditol 2-dehydrogenase